MLSALIIAADARAPAPPSPEAVVRSLAALVPAAIEGLVRDVVLAAPTGNEDLRRIADHAGCEIAEAADPRLILAAGMKKARGDALLVLRAGYAPERGFFEEVADLGDQLSRLRAVKLRSTPETFVTRLFPGLAPVVGLIGLRAHLRMDASDIDALIRAAPAGTSMRARLRRVG